jgi:hypothetical protein
MSHYAMGQLASWLDGLGEKEREDGTLTGQASTCADMRGQGGDKARTKRTETA